MSVRVALSGLSNFSLFFFYKGSFFKAVASENVILDLSQSSAHIAQGNLFDFFLIPNSGHVFQRSRFPHDSLQLHFSVTDIVASIFSLGFLKKKPGRQIFHQVASFCWVAVLPFSNVHKQYMLGT